MLGHILGGISNTEVGFKQKKLVDLLYTIYSFFGLVTWPCNAVLKQFDHLQEAPVPTQ